MSAPVFDRTNRRPTPRHGHGHHHAHPRHDNRNTARVENLTITAARTEALLQIIPRIKVRDLLTLRLVCKSWNQLICSSKVPGQVAPLWNQGGRLHFDATPSTVTPGISNRAKVQALTVRFEAFTKSTLITVFNCPYYRFFRLDARFEIVRKFFRRHGSDIKALHLDYCILSLVAFQRILKDCSSLEMLKVTGMFHCLSMSESLLSSKREPRLNGLINLRSLTFESSYVPTLQRRKRSRRVNFETDLETQDMHPAVIREILLSAGKVERLTFSGFGIATVNRVLNILAQYPIHVGLNHLRFYNIPNDDSPGSLRDMTELAHLKLKKFALTFLDDDQRNVILQSDSSPKFELLDESVRKILLMHQYTLESLDLTNCNVTEAIFSPAEGLEEVPALRQLCLRGTRIMGLSESSKVVLRKYLESDGVAGLRGTGSGPIPKSTVDEIIDSALFDLTYNAISDSVSGTNPPKISREHPRGGFCIFYKFDAFCLTLVFLMSVACAYYYLIDWDGDSTVRTTLGVATISFVLIYTLFSIITTSCTDG